MYRWAGLDISDGSFALKTSLFGYRGPVRICGGIGRQHKFSITLLDYSYWPFRQITLIGLRAWWVWLRLDLEWAKLSVAPPLKE